MEVRNRGSNKHAIAIYVACCQRHSNQVMNEHFLPIIHFLFDEEVHYKVAKVIPCRVKGIILQSWHLLFKRKLFKSFRERILVLSSTKLGPKVAAWIQYRPGPVTWHGKVEEFVQILWCFLRINFTQNRIIVVFGDSSEEGLREEFNYTLRSLANYATNNHFPVVSHADNIIAFWRVFSHIIVDKVGTEQVGQYWKETENESCLENPALQIRYSILLQMFGDLLLFWGQLFGIWFHVYNRFGFFQRISLIPRIFLITYS